MHCILSALHVQCVDWMATTSVTVLFHLLSLCQLPSGKVGIVICVMPNATSISWHSGLAYHFGLTSSEKLDGELVGSKFDSLGLADKVQLVKNVAQAVQVTLSHADKGVGLNILLICRTIAVTQPMRWRSFTSKLQGLLHFTT